MNNMLHVSSSPHVRDRVTTKNLMYDVVIALIPATVWGAYQFGLYTLAVVIATVLACVASEYVWEKGMGKPITITDGSAVVTGMILALNMPPEIPIWIPMLGGVFAIIVVKQLFGGLGQNFMNPALAARCFLLISFASYMNNFTSAAIGFDAVSGATPLAAMRAGSEVDLAALIVGRIPGTIGEVSSVALLIGAVYMIVRKVISPRIPLIYIGTVAVFIFIFGGFDVMYTVNQIFAGGLIFGAFFMATDYVTSPITKKGQVVFGILLGLLTGIFRLWGGSPEGVSYAIILSNLCMPMIEKLTLPVAFGKEGKSMNMKGIVKDAMMLFLITLIAGALLGAVHEVTLEPIAKAQQEAANATYREVFPEAANFVATDELTAAVADTAEEISAQGFGSVTVDGAMEAQDGSGNLLGYLITATSKEGYGGDVQISVGISTERWKLRMDLVICWDT